MLKRIVDILKKKHPAGSKRSGGWPAARKAFLATHPTCALCGGKSKLEVHHKRPFHLHPELELDQTNFIVLCEAKKGGINCHLAFGHMGNYKLCNPSVEGDAKAWAAKVLAAHDEAAKLDRHPFSDNS